MVSNSADFFVVCLSYDDIVFSIETVIFNGWTQWVEVAGLLAFRTSHGALHRCISVQLGTGRAKLIPAVQLTVGCLCVGMRRGSG